MTINLLDTQKLKVIEQNNSLKLMIEENEKLTKRNQSLKNDFDYANTNLKTTEVAFEKIKRQNEDIQKTINSKVAKLKIVEKINEKLNADITNQNKIIESLKVENDKLKNLKWYQRVFNK